MNYNMVMPLQGQKSEGNPSGLITFVTRMIIFFVIFFLFMLVIISKNAKSNLESVGLYAYAKSFLSEFISTVIIVISNGFHEWMATLKIYGSYIFLGIIFVGILCLIFYISILKRLIFSRITKLNSKIHILSLMLLELNKDSNHGLSSGINAIKINRLHVELHSIQNKLNEYRDLLKRFEKKRLEKNK